MGTNENVIKVFTACEHEDVSVVVNYFKVNEGKTVCCNELAEHPTAWIHAKVKVDLHVTDSVKVYDNGLALGIYKLYVNDEFIGETFDHDICEADNGRVFKFDVIMADG